MFLSSAAMKSLQSLNKKNFNTISPKQYKISRMSFVASKGSHRPQNWYGSPL